MSRRRVIRIMVIHGRGTKPSKACKLRYVRNILTEGVRRVDPRAGAWLAAHPHVIQLAYYADLFRRPRERPEPCASFREPIARLYAESQACPSWIRFRSFMQGLGVDLASQGLRFLQMEVRRQIIGQQFGDAMRYFLDHAFASRIRLRLQARLVPALRRREPVLLIAHSLGSVVAYDVLWKLAHMSEYAALHRRAIDHFVTLGSPLGDRFIKAQLLGWRYPVRQRYPTNVVQWTNLSARGDLICHDARLADDFRPMIRLGAVRQFREHVHLCTVYRGRRRTWNPHKLYGYLILPELGRIVAAHLRSHAFPVDTPFDNTPFDSSAGRGL